MIAQAGPAPPLERIQGIRDRFAEGGSYGNVVWTLVLVVAAAVLLLLAIQALRYWRARRLHSPRKLFLEVVQSIGLSDHQRDLLWRISRDLGMSHPVMLMLSPHLLRHHFELWINTKRSADPELHQSVDELAELLFPRKL